jgi:hypothetical protein
MGARSILSSAQDLTASWADLGDEQRTGGYRWVGLWVTVDINDSNDVRIKALAKHASGGTEEYSLPIKTVSAGSIAVQDEYFELTDDADQKVLLTWELDYLVPYVQFQVEAGTVGATAGQIDNAYVTRAG